MSRYRSRIAATLTTPEDAEIHAQIKVAHEALMKVMDVCRNKEKSLPYGAARSRIKRTMRDTSRSLSALNAIRTIGTRYDFNDTDLSVEDTKRVTVKQTVDGES